MSHLPWCIPSRHRFFDNNGHDLVLLHLCVWLTSSVDIFQPLKTVSYSFTYCVLCLFG